MFNAFCFLASSAILFYVLKYRVHVHVTLTSSRDSIHASRGKGRRASNASTRGSSTAMTRPVQPIAVTPESIVWGDRINDIASGLVNLQVKPGRPIPATIAKRARRAAERALEQCPDGSFDIQFTVALQEVGRAA